MASISNIFTIITDNNLINENELQENELQDIIVTVDDKDLENLKKIKLTKKLNLNCSICMDAMKKNDEIIELKCSHKYHANCILKYLKEYNHRCPVCRIEIGDAKYNLN